MKRQNLPHLDKLKQNLSKIFTLIFVFYITIIISLYKCYNNKVKMEKAQVLQTQYNKIVEVSMHKLTSLSHRLSSSIEESNISINSNSSEIEICNEALVCTNCSLFHFGELLNRNIPEFIHYTGIHSL